MTLRVIAAFVALAALGACGSVDVPALGGIEGSSGAVSGTGGTATATGGATITTGWMMSAAGGTGGMGGVATPSSTGGTGMAGSSTADSGARHDSGADHPDASTARPLATSLTLPTVTENPGVAPWFKVYRPADLPAAATATGHALPIVVWANGGCLRSAPVWEPLFNRWAAAGFVVLALDVGQDGNALASTTVDHQSALIDWAIAEAEKPGGLYGGKLDTGRIVAAGNSCGGVTALGVAARDARVKSVFVLSGSSSLAGTDGRIMAAISAPVGYIVGGIEDIAAASALADYEAMANGAPGMIMSRSSGDHVFVSTDVNTLAQEAEISLSWMDLCLYGTPKALAALTSTNVCTSCDPGAWKLKFKNLDTLSR